MDCTECYNTEVKPWYEQPVNDEIRAYARAYVSPVKIFYKDLDEAMKVWNIDE